MRRTFTRTASPYLAPVSEPFDLLFEPLGVPHDGGEWLIHPHLPPTTLYGHGRLRLLPGVPRHRCGTAG